MFMQTRGVNIFNLATAIAKVVDIMNPVIGCHHMQVAYLAYQLADARNSTRTFFPLRPPLKVLRIRFKPCQYVEGMIDIRFRMVGRNLKSYLLIALGDHRKIEACGQYAFLDEILNQLCRLFRIPHH